MLVTKFKCRKTLIEENEKKKEVFNALFIRWMTTKKILYFM